MTLQETVTAQAITCKDADILLVEIGNEDYVPTENDIREASELFNQAINDVGGSCKAVVVVNRSVGMKAQGVNLKEAIALLSEAVED